jgi:hypothetical protein
MVDDRKTSSTYSYCLKLEKLRLILYNKNEEVDNRHFCISCYCAQSIFVGSYGLCA